MMNGRPLHELMAEYEPERLAEIARDEARRNTPAALAAAARRKAEEHERGVLNGWWDANGDPIPDPEEDDAADDWYSLEEPEIDE